MNWKLLAICLLVTLSGCTLGDQPGRGSFVSFSGEIDSSGDEFLMEGYIDQDGTDTQMLNNVFVCGYSESGELLFAQPVPPFEVKQDITIRNDQHPHYILIYSEEFWASDTRWPFSDDKVDAVRYWELLEKGYAPEWADAKDDLPIDTDRPLENGCPA